MAICTHNELQVKGRKTFAGLLRYLMDANQWSHPKMIELTKAAMAGTSWLHSSQISGLQHAKLLSPGPRVFKAIQVLNEALFNYSTKKKLIPGTTSSNNYAKAIHIVDENGHPPSTGWFTEVFIGEREWLHSHNFWLDMPSYGARLLSQAMAMDLRKRCHEEELDPIETIKFQCRVCLPRSIQQKLATKLRLTLLGEAELEPAEFRQLQEWLPTVLMLEGTEKQTTLYLEALLEAAYEKDGMG